jgi:hypothetical protein
VVDISQTAYLVGALVVGAVVLVVLHRAYRMLSDIREASRHQVELLERQVQLLELQGRAQGWLLPIESEPWRPSHLKR